MAKKKKIKRKITRRKPVKIKRKKVTRRKITHKKVRSKSARKRKLIAVARKKARLLLHSPQFFVLASHPAMYTRPPAYVREKLEKK